VTKNTKLVSIQHIRRTPSGQTGRYCLIPASPAPGAPSEPSPSLRASSDHQQISSHPPSKLAACQSNIDGLFQTPRNLKSSFVKVRQPAAVTTDGPPSNADHARKPEFGTQTASHDILLWLSMKPLLRAAGVDPQEKHAIDGNDIPKLHIDTSSGDNNDPDCRSSISGDALETHLGTSIGCLADGRLDSSVLKTDSCFSSFMNRFSIMHPFLAAIDMRERYDEFIARYDPRSQHLHTAGVGNNPDLRRRPHHTDASSIVQLKLLLDDAMMFLVLALGAICEHEGPMQPTRPPHLEASNDRLYAPPGLIDFRTSVKILSSIDRADTLIHAQIYLLAGLYVGQFARVEESMSWYTQAGGVLRSLTNQHKLYKNRPWTAESDLRKELEESLNLVTSEMQHSIILASWACLQLEGEVLARLHLPSSGIHTMEDRLLLPQIFLGEDHGVLSHEKQKERETYLEKLFLIYTAQEFLRKRTNQLNNDLYGSDFDLDFLTNIRVVLQNHKTTLDIWSNGLPSTLKWYSGGSPCTDTLLAQLGAKYWEARCVADRHYLDYALNVMPYVQVGCSIRDVASDAYGRSRGQAEVRILEAIAMMSDGELWAGCQRCVDAAIQSIVAFDGISGRLIVPNIHNTAHA
jgi:hypothetical protein